LSGIAAKHGVPLSSLARSNGISNTRLIYPGQKLVVQRPAHASSAQPSGRSGPSASAAAASPPSTAPQQSVRVQADDTLYGLAAAHGVSVSSIIQANPGIRPRSLPVGSTVRIPSTASTQPHPEPETPEPIAGSPTDLGVEDSLPHHTYAAQVASSAEVNREYLASVPVPSRSQTRSMIITTARRHGVDPALMLALAYQVSGWNQRAVSPANAIGIMQVVPSSGQWASSLVGRRLNLLDPQDNVTAGVVIMRALQRSASNQHEAIGGYYQGLSSVQRHGLFADTRAYVKSITALRARL